MKVLVTGKDGQLGKSIHKLILNLHNDIEYILVGRKELDLSNSESISKYFNNNTGFNLIINCAAYTAVDKAEEESDLANQINHIALKQIADFANSQNAKLIHISTDYVFDGDCHFPYLESDNTNPINIYGKTKLLGEKIIQRTMKNNAIIIRTSWLYSEFGHNFVKTMLKLGSEREEVTVVNDQIGTPTYATDLAEAIINIVNNENFKIGNFPSEIYNFSNLGEASWYDFAKEIFKFSNLNCKLTPICSQQFPVTALRPKYTTMSKDKIIDKFQLRISSWQKSLQKCLRTMT